MAHFSYLKIGRGLLDRWGPTRKCDTIESAIKETTQEEKKLSVSIAILAELRLISEPIKQAKRDAEYELRTKLCKPLLDKVINMSIYGPAHRRLQTSFRWRLRDYTDNHYGYSNYPYNIDSLLTIPESKWTIERLIQFEGIGKKTAATIIAEYKHAN